MEIARLTIPWDVTLTACNKLRRGGHWAQRHRVMKRARLLARMCWVDAGSPVSPGPVRLSILVRRARRVDHFNAVAGVKPLVDGVFQDALTPDDTPKWLEVGTVSQEIHADFKGREEVVFIVEALG